LIQKILIGTRIVLSDPFKKESRSVLVRKIPKQKLNFCINGLHAVYSTRRTRASQYLSQYHLAVAGGCAAAPTCYDALGFLGFAPTRYREVVLTKISRGVC